jgi:hypothetical protein
MILISYLLYLLLAAPPVAASIIAAAIAITHDNGRSA